MARFHGMIGYANTVETVPGVWKEIYTERPYTGDIQRDFRRLQNSEGVNDNISTESAISVLADAYAYEHFHAIRYVVWMGAKWKVTTVGNERPRLILTIGGVYNAEPSLSP